MCEDTNSLGLEHNLHDLVLVSRRPIASVLFYHSYYCIFFFFCNCLLGGELLRDKYVFPPHPQPLAQL